MSVLFEIGLENEMDIMLSHQKMMRCAELLKLNLTTRTTFVTAISELARVIVEHTDHGVLKISLDKADLRYRLNAIVTYPRGDGKIEESLFRYVKKLVPVLEFFEDSAFHTIIFVIGLPKSHVLAKDTLNKVFSEMKDTFISPYEEIKNRNTELFKVTEQQREELLVTQRINELKNEFLSVASHELKTPLTILQAYIQLAGRLSNVEEIHGMMSKIDTQLKKMSHLSVKLLDSVRVGNGALDYNKHEVEINPFLDQVVQQLALIVPENELRLNLGEPCVLTIDPVRIEQVVSNIITNAAKYSKKGTVIEISSKICSSNALEVAVKDNGMGMNKETLENIFQKFYRDKDVALNHSGLGVGMYISSEIVKAHGGQIWVESEFGKGSTFFFSIPF